MAGYRRNNAVTAPGQTRSTKGGGSKKVKTEAAKRRAAAQDFSMVPF